MPVPGDGVAIDQLAVSARIVERVGRIAHAVRIEAFRVGGHRIERSDDAVDLDPIPVDGNREVAQGPVKGRAQHRTGRQSAGNLGFQFGIAAQCRNLVRQEAGRAVGVGVLVENRRPRADDRRAERLNLRPVGVGSDISPRRLGGDGARIRWRERHHIQRGAGKELRGIWSASGALQATAKRHVIVDCPVGERLPGILRACRIVLRVTFSELQLE